MKKKGARSQHELFHATQKNYCVGEAVKEYNKKKVLNYSFALYIYDNNDN